MYVRHEEERLFLEGEVFQCLSQSSSRSITPAVEQSCDVVLRAHLKRYLMLRSHIHMSSLVFAAIFHTMARTGVEGDIYQTPLYTVAVM